MNASDRSQDSTRSRAAIRGHPLHPMILPFPLVFLTTALVSDLVFLSSGDPFWARASFYCLFAGVVTGVLAGLLGAIDFMSIREARAHSVGWVHSIGNVIALILSTANLLVRWGQAEDIVPLGITFSVLSALLLGLTGWAGGEMSYRHRVGVDDTA